MINTSENSEKFFKEAMIDIGNKLMSKMKALGYNTEEEVQHEIDLGRLVRFEMTSDQVISWRYEHNGVLVLETIWTPTSLTYKDINKDERNLSRNSI